MKGGRRTRGFSVRGKQSATAGFTIVETLIVLSVTAFLFAAIATALSGRQNQTEFTQAVNDIRSQIQQTINEISSGYFPDSTFSCTAKPLYTSITLASGGQGQGTNGDCMFLGKVMQFTSDGDPELFYKYSLAGIRADVNGNPITKFSTTYPTIIAPTDTQTDIPDITEQGRLIYGLTLKSMQFDTGSGQDDIAAFAIVNSLGTATSSGISSGSQQLEILPIDNGSLTVGNGDTASEKGAAVAQINNFMRTAQADSLLNPSGKITMCFVSGGTNNSGQITIGGTGEQLAVKLSIFYDKSCGSGG